jgi:hypothetical protein
MNHLYEYLLHEWNYVCFLADHYDLLPCASMTHNMISERFHREEDDDTSAFDSVSYEDEQSGDDEVLVDSSHV